MDRPSANGCRFRPGDPAGHYESYFQRANHPTRPLAFWIRYTIFAPKGRPDDAVGELWAMFFDGEAKSHVAVKTVHPMADCSFSPHSLDARVEASVLNGAELTGSAEGGGHRLSWSLSYTAEQSPLLLLGERYYAMGFPKAKALVPAPNAVFDGTIMVDGQTIPVEGWRGSQNHNWGLQHTDRYAWGQVAGFDDDPTAFLECSTAQLRLGPVWSPRFTLVVLRVDGEEFALNGLRRAVLARGRYRFFDWSFSTRQRGVWISGRIFAEAADFVALPYDNPPGGVKTCLNSKLASCTVKIARPGFAEKTLHTNHRAAFEILTDRDDHGVRRLEAPSSQ